MKHFAAIVAYIFKAVQGRKKSQLFLDSSVLFAVSFAIYQLLQAIVITQDSLTLCILHVLGAILLVCMASIRELLSTPKSSSRYLIFPSFIMILAVGCLLYAWAESARLELKWPWISNNDVVVGFMLFFAVLAATWLAWGPALSLVGVIGILYFLFGQHLPGLLGHEAASLPFAISYLGMSLTTGMFWLMSLSMTVFFPLMVFGIVIRATGATDAFTELLKWASRASRAAGVYVCVVESGLVGMVTGSSATNVVLTGSVTIPAMKGIGLQPRTAAGLEALASTGSQIVPPMMGLAAFVMAQLIGMPYVSVMFAAIIPAAMYYGGLMVSAYFAAQNELGMSRSIAVQGEREEIDWRKFYRLLPTFVIPLGGLIGLLATGYSPLYAGTLAIIAALLLSQTQGKALRPSFGRLALGISEGAILGSQIAVICMSIGFLGQAFITTGLGLRLSRVFEAIMGGNFALSLAVLMGVTIIIGMGAPTVVAYTLVSIAVIPAVQDLGLEMIVAHFFAFYFACFSHISPPVAGACVTASRIAGSDFWPTAWYAMKLSFPLFLVPFAFVFHPELLNLFEMSYGSGLAILGYLLLVVNGVGSAWGGLPILRMGVVSRIILAIAAIADACYIFGGGNIYLMVLLIGSLVGWVIPLLRTWKNRTLGAEQ